MLGRKVIFKDVLDSTNNYVAKLVLEGKIEHGTVILAGSQTAGRGQRGSQWESEPFSNLIYSCFFKHDNFAVDKQFLFSQCISNACLELLNGYSEGFFIKWPNDLLFHTQKIAGILIENSWGSNSVKHSIVGIGMNINQEEFGDYHATSLLNITGKQFDIHEISFLLNEKLSSWYDCFKFGDDGKIKSFYLNHLWLLNEESDFQKGNTLFRGTIRGLSDLGELLIETENGLESFQHKEVQFLARNPY